MSQYIHEIVLQEFVIENYKKLNISINYQNNFMELINVSFNHKGTFWDLEGQLENGIWIPIEVEWLSSNFSAHKHHLSNDFSKFLHGNGIVLVLRKNKELPKVKQISILENISQTVFENLFNNWFKNKSKDYSSSTLNDYLVGHYKRSIPRILVIPISKNARNNYFSKEPLYRKKENNPLLIGFKESGYKNNEFVRDIQQGDICVFIDSDGNRTSRIDFISNIKTNKIRISRLAAFKIQTSLYDVRLKKINVDDYFWPDEIKASKIIYPYRGKLYDYPFIDMRNKIFPYIKGFSDEKWESFRSCIQYGKYFEISPLDFISLISCIGN